MTPLLTRAPILSSTPKRPHAAPAVAKKQTALRERGRTLVLMLSKMPVTSGAMIPESLDNADAIPDAVPLVCAHGLSLGR